MTSNTRKEMKREKWMLVLISIFILVSLFYTYGTNGVNHSNKWHPFIMQRNSNVSYSDKGEATNTQMNSNVVSNRTDNILIRNNKWDSAIMQRNSNVISSDKWEANNTQRNSNVVFNKTDILIVGSGFSGAVLAYLHASILNHTVLVIEKRDHIGGNCYDYIDKSGIRVSKYGQHTFYTNDKKTWDFISQFTKWLPYKSRLMGFIDNKYVPLPPNINTVNSVTGLNISTVDEMKQWIDKNWINSEDFLKGKTLQDKHKGMDIYKKVIEPFSHNYFPFIEKDDEKMNSERLSIRHNFDTSGENMPNVQTNRSCQTTLRCKNTCAVPEYMRSPFVHVPRRLNHNTGGDIDESAISAHGCDIDEIYQTVYIINRLYSNVTFQGIPRDGYTTVINKLLNHPNIVVHLNTEFSRSFLMNENISFCYYTGRIDEYFKNVGLPKLEYESIKFEKLEIPNTLFFQPAPVIYYFNETQKNSKITEYKHFSNLRGKNFTLTVKEQLSKEGVPLLPLRTSRNSQLYQKYRSLTQTEEKRGNIRFVGGLTTHEYLDMATTITRAIETFENSFNRTIKPYPPIVKTRRKSSLSIIVNHCSKGLQWLANDFGKECADREMNIFIYEKCGSLGDGKRFIKSYPACNGRQIVLPNIGREGHSWIYHLLTQSVHFYDINVFLQGGKEVPTTKLNDYIARYDVSKFIKEENSVDTPLLSLIDTYATLNFERCATRYLGFSPHAEQEICKWYTLFTHSDEKCNKFMVPHRGEMIVSESLLRRALSKHSKFLLDMYRMLSKSNDPIEGHVLERLWITIFRWPHVKYCE